MPTAVINQPHARVQLTGERLEVFVREEETAELKRVREIPLRDVDRVVMGSSVHLTNPALTALLEAAIPIQIFSWKGRFLGGFLPGQNHHGFSRLSQYQRTLDPGFALRMAGRIITAKIYNQRRVLQRPNPSCDPKEDTPTDPSPNPTSADLEPSTAAADRICFHVPGVPTVVQTHSPPEGVTRAARVICATPLGESSWR